MNTLKQYRPPAAALLLLISAHANSATCGEMSPRLLELGGLYHEPISAAPSLADAAHEELQLSTLEQLLGGAFHSGSGVRVTCLGTGDRARPVTAHFDLKEIEQRDLLNGERLLAAIEDVHSVQVDSDDRIDDTRAIRSIKLLLPSVDSWTLDASGHGLSSVTAHRRQNALQASLLHERVWHAVPAGNGVDLEVRDYTNGIHDGSMLWRLRRS